MDKKKEEGVASASPVVLCGASAYEQKYYLNEAFQNLPEQIREELQIMCVLFTEDIGGVFLLEFDGSGTLQFYTEAQENDFSYDEIGCALKIKELRRTKADLLRSLELYYKILTGKMKTEDIPEDW
ncbi:MAG: DUF6145 family protein [Lachnospiraceae bacterium]|nr:DUF6145 family protein [Lachnospiraceae bacterium]